nr:BET1-like protein At4g14600 [Tanacetum cinerariifolium]
MASSSNRGGGYYGAAPYRSREGLSTRQGTGSDEIQLRIDPMHADLDDEISGLRKQVRQLKNVASEIESEAKFQNEFINQLQMTLIKAQAGVKNNMRRLNKSIVQSVREKMCLIEGKKGLSDVSKYYIDSYGVVELTYVTLTELSSSIHTGLKLHSDC